MLFIFALVIGATLLGVALQSFLFNIEQEAKQNG